MKRTHLNSGYFFQVDYLQPCTGVTIVEEGADFEAIKVEIKSGIPNLSVVAQFVLPTKEEAIADASFLGMTEIN